MYVRPRPRFRPRNAGSGSSPTLALNFLGGSLDPAVTFSRGTQATQYTSNGTLQYAPNNLLTYSNQADNAAWTKSNSFVQTNLLLQSQTFNTSWTLGNLSAFGSGSVADATIAPDGTLTADRLAVSTASAYVSLLQVVNVTASTTYTFSYWLNTTTSLSGNTTRIYNVTGAADIVAGQACVYSGGWVRQTCTFTTPVGCTQIYVYPISVTVGAGTVGQYFDIWGAQCVQGSVPGDYRATTSAALPVLYADYNGVVRARKLCESNANSTHSVSQGITTTATPYTFSVYAKQPSDGSARRYFLVYHSQSNSGWVFDLQTGTLGVGGTTGVSAPVSYAITYIGNGWYRCQITVNATAASNSFLHYLVDNNGSGGSVYTGDGSSGIYIADAQLEAGGTVQAYNDTTSAAYYGPRFDYDPTNLVRQNLLTYSQDLSTYWVYGTGVTLNPTAIMAPDGTMTARTVSYSAGGGTEFLRNSTSAIAASTAQTFSFWAKSISGNTSFSLDLQNIEGTTVTLTSDWQRFTWTVTPAAARTWIDFQLAAAGTVALWGAQLNTGSTALTYTATTTAPYTLVAARGLLIEEQRANLLTYSDGTIANLTSSNNVTNATTALNPSFTNSIQFSDNTLQRFAYKVATTTAATVYTLSVFVCMDDNSTPVVGTTITSGDFCLVFEGNLISVASTVTALGNSTHRVQVTVTAAGGAGLNIGVIKYTGQSVKGFRITGFQLETGAFATSYIPTVASQVTRAADVANVNTLSPWFNAVSGTLYGEADIYSPASLNVTNLATINDGTTSNVHRLLSYNGKIGGSTTTAGSTIADLQPLTYTTNTTFKFAYAYAANDFAAVGNGGAPSTDAAGSLPTGLNVLSIGNLSGVFWSGHVRSINYYPTRLPNATLQSLTV